MPSLPPSITMTTPAPSSSPASSMLRQQSSQQQQPAKSILKTPSTIGQKRKHIDMDLASDFSISEASHDGDVNIAPSQTPRKNRSRVKFDLDFLDQSRSGMTTPKESAAPAAAMTPTKATREKSVALVREEVRRAILRHLAGDSEAYDRIKALFSADPKAVADDESMVCDLPTPMTLKNHLLGLLANVSALDGNCNGLVQAVLSSEWVGRDESYVKLFVKFLGTLAAARGVYLQSVLKMLVGNLHQVPNSARKLPDHTVIHTSEVYHRTHLGIQYIVRLIPAGSAALATILLSGFPNDTDSPKAHIAYTRNWLKIIDYAPELRGEILALITEKIVKIDVQVQVDMEDLEEEMEEDVLQSLSSAEDIALEDDEDSDAESVVSSEDLDSDADRLKMTKSNLKKIDYMMDMLFEYYALSFTSGSLDEQENTLQLLLAHFENIILPTYRSRHSQFLLFHFAQSSPILVDRFATMCIQIIFSKSQPMLIRQYAAAYLASFVARGKHVSGEVVRDVFDLLGTHLRSLRSEYEPNCRGPDLRRYGTFYSTAQALFYIFCFRWRDLTTVALEAEEDDNQTRSLDDIELDEVRFPPSVTETMRGAVWSTLNPLKVCSPAIVEEFARIAHHLNFIYIYSILETNKRVRVQSSRGFTSRALNAQFGQIEREIKADDDRGIQLDAYFPFDPYHLRRSGRWLEGDYVAWRGIPGLQNRDDDSDSRRDEDEYMEDDEESDEE